MTRKGIFGIWKYFLAAHAVSVLPVFSVREQECGRRSQKPVMVLHRNNQVRSAEHMAEEAISLAQTKTEFLAKVSHELRSPLTSIMGVSEMLDYGVYGPLSREQKEAVRVVSECAQDMARLVNDLLEQSRLERGSFHLEEVDYRLEDLTQRVRQQASPTARAKGLTLIVEVDKRMPETLRGDPLRMYQVVHNLVDNAIKYTPSGEVALRYARGSNGTYTIEVSDTGIGIPKEVRDTIFEPFRRVPRTPGEVSGNGDNHDNPGGFGLGLSIVKQLVQLMNGEIRVASEEGKGSTFSVRLPIQAAAEVLA